MPSNGNEETISCEVNITMSRDVISDALAEHGSWQLHQTHLLRRTEAWQQHLSGGLMNIVSLVAYLKFWQNEKAHILSISFNQRLQSASTDLGSYGLDVLAFKMPTNRSTYGLSSGTCPAWNSRKRVRCWAVRAEATWGRELLVPAWKPLLSRSMHDHVCSCCF